MADLRVRVSDAQEGEYSASADDARLPPLHGHVQGRESAECESAGCALPLKLPSLSALGITDTIRTALTKSPQGMLATSPRTVDGLSLEKGARTEEHLRRAARSVNKAKAVGRQKPTQDGASPSGALEILAAASTHGEIKAGPAAGMWEDPVNGNRSGGGLALSVQRCLWSTCTQIFSSIDELVRHLYKLHVATNRTSIS
ncbi:hypothetical protein GGI23_004701, partial [Coemansia sp. RSA 2559]